MWQLEAKCVGEYELFFSELKSKVAKAKAICSECPVKGNCLEFAFANNEEFGTFGGYTAEERKSLAFSNELNH